MLPRCGQVETGRVSMLPLLSLSLSLNATGHKSRVLLPRHPSLQLRQRQRPVACDRRRPSPQVPAGDGVQRRGGAATVPCRAVPCSGSTVPSSTVRCSTVGAVKRRAIEIALPPPRLEHGLVRNRLREILRHLREVGARPICLCGSGRRRSFRRSDVRGEGAAISDFVQSASNDLREGGVLLSAWREEAVAGGRGPRKEGCVDGSETRSRGPSAAAWRRDRIHAAPHTPHSTADEPWRRRRRRPCHTRS